MKTKRLFLLGALCLGSVFISRAEEKSVPFFISTPILKKEKLALNRYPTLLAEEEEEECYSDIEGKGFGWKYAEGRAPSNPIVENFQQPGTDRGFVLDIYKLDNSFNMIINGVPLHFEELEFQISGTTGQNVRFKSDGSKWEANGIPDIWKINETATIDLNVRENNPTPAIRVVIDKDGNVRLFGKRSDTGELEELEIFDKTTGAVVQLATVPWNTDSDNVIQVTQSISGPTQIQGFGYGLSVRECENIDLSIEKKVKKQEDGEAIFLLTVKNNSEKFDDEQVVVEDLLPSGYEFISYTASQGTYDKVLGVWTVGELTTQQTETIEIRVKIKTSGEFLNKASVSGSYPDKNPANNKAEAIVALGKLVFTKRYIPKDYILVGDQIEYEILVKNIGQTTVTDIILADENADVSSLVPSTISELKQGEEKIVKALHTITIEDFRAKEVINQATLAGKTSSGNLTLLSDDPTTSTPNDATVTPLKYQADLHATKDDNLAYYKPGQTTTYTVVVENKGPGSAIDVIVEDPTPTVDKKEWTSSRNTSGVGDLYDSIPFLQVGDKVTYTVTLIIPESHRGKFVNIVYVSAEENEDPNPICDTCTDINYQDVFIPRGISPNLDGKNDALDLADYDIVDIKIYNRLGVEVYSAAPYSKEWYGQHSSSSTLLPSATYYYIIHNILGDQYTGWIHLLY
ncbi:gliding motility-associated C-terminal domain-containing protein [Myroides odoratus]|uniref:DUF7507 domain-containing protein n=1 Tax=Myroides odoratus TaxID=256 RepID=UPI003342D898